MKQLRKVETIETKTAYEAIRAINNLLEKDGGDQIYREQLAELFTTLKWLNTPQFQIEDETT